MQSAIIMDKTELGTAIYWAADCWSPDPISAIRFARRSDAEATRARMQLGGCVEDVHIEDVTAS